MQCVKHKRNSPSSKIDVSFKAGDRCLADETYLELNRDVAFQFNRIARIKYDLNRVQNLIPFVVINCTVEYLITKLLTCYELC